MTGFLAARRCAVRVYALCALFSLGLFGCMGQAAIETPRAPLLSVPIGEGARPAPPPAAKPVLSPQPQIAERTLAPGESLAPAPPPAAGAAPAQGPVTGQGEIVASLPPSPPPRKLSPRETAALQLVTEGDGALRAGEPDRAVTLGEQAVRLDGGSGPAFFLLARAWQKKGVLNKSAEFARKAEVLLQNDARSLKDLYLFQSSLYRDLNDPQKADLYRERAQRL